MSFDSWQAFWQMGGYAFYVWSSYGLTVLVLAWVLLAPRLRRRELTRAAEHQRRRVQSQPETSP